MLIDKSKACLVLFNMQLGLIPLLYDGARLLHDCCWLADVSKTFDIPIIVIEHKKLGASAVSLKEVAASVLYLEKIYFDCLYHGDIRQAIESTGCSQFIIAGAESHVCIFQSALSFQQQNKEVFVVSDATSARSRADHDAALKRMEHEQITLVTKEMFFFELIRYSEYPNYNDTAMKFLDGRYIK